MTTPYILEKSNDNLIVLDVYSKLMYESQIIFVNEITDDSANIINAQMMYLMHSIETDNRNNEEKTIKLYINSPGGDVLAGNSILDVMDIAKRKNIIVETYNCGLAASMGSVILCNGTKGFRHSLKRARTMLHQPSGGAYGQLTDLEITINEINILKKGLYETIQQNSNMSYKTIEKKCERDTWLSPEETLKLGLIDNII